MSIKDFLSPDHVSVDVRISEKNKLLRELAHIAFRESGDNHYARN
jgi:hypothetical protein